MVLKRTVVVVAVVRALVEALRPFSSDPSCQLDVLGHDGDPLGVDSAEVGVFKEAD